MRRTLIADRPRTLETSSVPPSGAAPNDFGLWLTHDLRPKGAPSDAPGSAPIVERPSEAQSLVIADAQEPELASWLLQDLKPRHSSPPDALSPDALSPDSLPPPDSLPLSDSLLPPDSLVPHAVSDAPRPAPSELGLEEEDLAVLPSRPGRLAQRRWRHVVVLAALLAVGGALFWGVGPKAAPGEREQAAANAPMTAVPLPPPPPPEGAEQEVLPPVELEPAAAPRARAATDAPEPDDTDPSGPRGRRAGDAVARFADLPLPTLSRLARDERQKARTRSAARPAQKPTADALP